ncbi:hypothetical protein PROFUN_08008 [Planoprotostelium fungivorum]|uniref:Uncharacterized protein n=1 Tax=Planoprotostelium fungivorum TaxID=1890364 RepID=A0A2P6MVA3_9EUKA|nr:hypothetical protein PROFUN_08008 [Planoprotostelium fungivorum]
MSRRATEVPRHLYRDATTVHSAARRDNSAISVAQHQEERYAVGEEQSDIEKSQPYENEPYPNPYLEKLMGSLLLNWQLILHRTCWKSSRTE